MDQSFSQQSRQKLCEESDELMGLFEEEEGESGCKGSFKEESSISCKIKATNCSQLSAEEKQTITTNLAEKFITIGYGYSKSLKALKKRGLKLITSSIYNNLMTCIMKKAFRTLETFLIKQCKQTIKPLSMYDCSLIRSPMIQAVKWLSKDDLSTLYKFIIRAYNLNKKVYISEDQASKLYGQLLQSASISNEVSHLMLHRHRKKEGDPRGREGLKFSYAPSTVVSTNRA